eukprot:3923078-Heterocapsa_arctica.AAC.1
MAAGSMMRPAAATSATRSGGTSPALGCCAGWIRTRAMPRQSLIAGLDGEPRGPSKSNALSPGSRLAQQKLEPRWTETRNL